jgi:alkylation response protein AidB-like acyl-CoA dehydrogenase
MVTTARAITLPSGEPGYEINGNEKWQTGMHNANCCVILARTSGKVGSAKGITAFIVPSESPGLTVVLYEWALNMPTDHATVRLKID